MAKKIKKSKKSKKPFVSIRKVVKTINGLHTEGVYFTLPLMFRQAHNLKKDNVIECSYKNFTLSFFVSKDQDITTITDYDNRFKLNGSGQVHIGSDVNKELVDLDIPWDTLRIDFGIKNNTVNIDLEEFKPMSKRHKEILNLAKEKVSKLGIDRLLIKNKVNDLGADKIADLKEDKLNEFEKYLLSFSNTVDSTSDNRVVNNVMRHQYKVLSDDEKVAMQIIKDKGLEFFNYLESFTNSRELSIAKTKLEECVMWAVKHITL